MNRPAARGPGISIHQLAAIAICIAVGHIFAPPTYKWLGGALGAIAGVVLGRLWRPEPSDGTARADTHAQEQWLGNIIYLVLASLSALMLWRALQTWFLRPERRLTAVAGVLFFLAAAAVLVTLWNRERRLRAGQQPRVNETVVFGIFGLAFGLASGVLIFTGSPVVGVVGLIFFGGAGLLALLRKPSR